MNKKLEIILKAMSLPVALAASLTLKGVIDNKQLDTPSETTISEQIYDPNFGSIRFEEHYFTNNSQITLILTQTLHRDGSWSPVDTMYHTPLNRYNNTPLGGGE